MNQMQSAPTNLPRIGLNAHLFSLSESYRSAGVSRYIQKLLEYLPRVDDAARYVAFLDKRAPAFPGWQVRRSWWRTASPPARIAWEQLAQPWAARRAKLDLLHAPVYVGPLLSPCPQVVTVHDLSFYLFPELFHPLKRSYLQRAVRVTARRALRVIADSASTQADIVRILGVAQERVTVIPVGVGEEMAPADPAAIQAFRRQHELPDHFILFLGTLEPRKNIPLLLQAYALLLAREPNTPYRLVIAGGKGWYYDRIDAAASRLGLAGKVIYPGYVPQTDLPLWYNAADVFVYPSLYEGFGLPPLEAMACGAPVIVSNSSSLPEVVGEAGVIVEPNDPQALAEAIRAVLGDEQRRCALRQAGLEQARRYTWANTARQTAQLYHQLLGARA